MSAHRLTPTQQLFAVHPQSYTNSTQPQQAASRFGVFAENVGATGLVMYLIEIPAGGSTELQIHRNVEVAMYLLAGRMATCTGDRLATTLTTSVVNEPGSFLFVPAGVPHRSINLSATQPVLAIVARTGPPSSPPP